MFLFFSDLRTSVTKEQQNLNKINKGTIASSLPEIPFILPIFAMSILGISTLKLYKVSEKMRDESRSGKGNPLKKRWIS